MSLPVFLRCAFAVFKSVLFVLVFASDFLVVRLRAVGRAVRNTIKFRSILLG
jgi:hypothetical protein